ncbi:hypothetical protein KO507_14220 [Gilvimarinus agarilyticus]|uniref:hypothetical protein n=1 Tax=Gilvimarinus sp. 2_MG-2023 TaxID=3062666 RepID=UPI001C08BC43|nr:hypothetical protein [Gilvimarinus sp. 2_MG-2023]MBU2886921.1 hypothetical protein [Gilvimarinus agarilyticus]
MGQYTITVVYGFNDNKHNVVKPPATLLDALPHNQRRSPINTNKKAGPIKETGEKR